MKHDLEKIPFGFLIGKTFCEVTLYELDKAISWLEEHKLDESWRYSDFCKKAEEYLKLNHFCPGTGHERDE